MTNIKDKKVVIFDLDGTLTESKQALDSEMADLLGKLLVRHQVAVIGGGSYKQFEKQFLPYLPKNPEILKNLFLFPTSGTELYKFENNSWKEVYEYDLFSKEKKQIYGAFAEAEKFLGIHEEKTFGEKIEDRLTQVTYSGIGQEAPLDVKKSWDPDQSKRKKIVEFISPLLPHLDIHIGGMTSIDITRKGINKAYGVREISKNLKTPIENMVFIGDALFPGGNDYQAKETGIECIQVKGPSDTKKLISDYLSA